MKEIFSKKEVYKYDPHGVKYIKIRKGVFYYLKLVVFYGSILALISYGLILVFFKVYDTDNSKKIKQQNTILLTALDKYEIENKVLSKRVDSLKAREKEIYKQILNEEFREEDDEEDKKVKAKSTAKKEMDLTELKKELKEMETKLAENTQKQSIMMDLAKKNKKELIQIPAIRPVKTEIICGYGKRKNPVTGRDKTHQGIDFKADQGTEVVATGDGYVLNAGSSNLGIGTTVVINHSYGYMSVYSCLSKVKVFRGQRVKRGQVIALSGASGLSKGPHLHYEIYKNSKPVDPIDYLYTDLSSDEFVKFKEKAARYCESMD